MTSQMERSFLNLSLGEITSGPVTEMKHYAAKKLLGEWKGYLDQAGMSSLRNAIVQRFQPLFSAPLTTDHVLVTAGASMALMSVFQMVPGKQLLIPNVCYPPYRKATEQIGVATHPYHIGPKMDWDKTLADMEAGLSSGVKAVLWNNPNNPLGCVAPRDVVERVARLCERYGALCVSDEVYRDFTFFGTETVSPALFIPERTIFIYSFSKAFAMAGMRIGFAIADPSIIRTLCQYHWNAAMSASWIGQETARFALESCPEYPRQLAREVEERIGIASRLFAKESGIPFFCPQGGLFICIDTEPLGMTGERFAQLLLAEARVLVMPGHAFGPDAKYLVRINTGVETSKFSEAMARIRDVYERQMQKCRKEVNA